MIGQKYSAWFVFLAIAAIICTILLLFATVAVSQTAINYVDPATGKSVSYLSAGGSTIYTVTDPKTGLTETSVGSPPPGISPPPGVAQSGTPAIGVGAPAVSIGSPAISSGTPAVGTPGTAVSQGGTATGIGGSAISQGGPAIGAGGSAVSQGGSAIGVGGSAISTGGGSAIGGGGTAVSGGSGGAQQVAVPASQVTTQMSPGVLNVTTPAGTTVLSAG